MVSDKSGYLKRSVFGQRYYSYFEAMLRSGANTDDVDCLASDTLADDDLWERGDNILRAALELGDLIAIGVDGVTKHRAEIPSTLWSSISVLGRFGCESDYVMRLGTPHPDYFIEEISPRSLPSALVWKSVIIEKDALRRWLKSSGPAVVRNHEMFISQVIDAGRDQQIYGSGDAICDNPAENTVENESEDLKDYFGPHRPTTYQVVKAILDAWVERGMPSDNRPTTRAVIKAVGILSKGSKEKAEAEFKKQRSAYEGVDWSRRGRQK